MHLPGVRNVTADIFSRQKLPFGEWRLNPIVVQMVWEKSVMAEVNLCLRGINTLPTVVFAHRTDLPCGAGCASASLTRPPSVCLTSDITAFTDTAQDGQVQQLGVAGYSLLAQRATGREYLAPPSRAPSVARLAPEGYFVKRCCPDHSWGTCTLNEASVCQQVKTRLCLV